MCASSLIFVRSSTFGVPSQRLWFWLVKAMGHHGCFSAASPESRQCGSWWESLKAISFFFWQPMALRVREKLLTLLDNQACFFLTLTVEELGPRAVSTSCLPPCDTQTHTEWERKRAVLHLHKSSGGLEINLDLSSLHYPPLFFPAVCLFCLHFSIFVSFQLF